MTVFRGCSHASGGTRMTQISLERTDASRAIRASACMRSGQWLSAGGQHGRYPQASNQRNGKTAKTVPPEDRPLRIDVLHDRDDRLSGGKALLAGQLRGS